MKIDAHQHFWIYDPVRDSWIDDSMKVLQKNFLPEMLVPILEQYNFDGCIAVQADQSEIETQFLLDLASKNTVVKGVVGWVDLCADTVEDRLAHFSKNKLFKGVRHIVQAEANDFMLRTDFQNGISKLEQFGLTYDILIIPEQLPAVIELAQKFPKQQFVIDHIAKPSIKDAKMDDWKDNMKALSRFPNVFCKVSGMVTEADWENWTPKDFTKYLDVILDAFGVDRVLYGSDWPVCLLAAKYGEQLDVLERYISHLSEGQITNIMGDNAIKFYNLNP